MIDYKHLYDIMVINPDKMISVDKILTRIKAHKPQYDEVSAATNVPWNVLGAIHYRESGLDFTRHLANGDPLTERTVHVPKGRPLKGEPPFTWAESAIDTLLEREWNEIKDWSMPIALQHIEEYNGLGYRKRGLPSPYIWSWTNIYHAGKYVADGKFDPNYVDQQCGAAVLLKLLM